MDTYNGQSFVCKPEQDDTTSDSHSSKRSVGAGVSNCQCLKVHSVDERLAYILWHCFGRLICHVGNLSSCLSIFDGPGPWEAAREAPLMPPLDRCRRHRRF